MSDLAMSNAQFSLPDTQVSKDVIERVQFSVSSRNAGAKVSECLTHVFVSPYCDDTSAIAWQYVSSGVTCLLRKKELAKSGRKMVWTVHLCLYNVTYGVLVWKGAISHNSCYTAVSDTFHVYVMHELNAIVGLLFDELSQGREFFRSYLQWDAEKVKEERGKGGGSPSPAQFRKEMISKPCNFQHIQGTQALDECIEIEKIKTDIQAAFFGLGSARARKETVAYRAKGSSGGKRKKDAGKPCIQLKNISVPHKMSTSRSDHMLVQASKSLDINAFGSLPPQTLLHTQESVPMDLGGRHSVPPQISLHRSQPDLLNSHTFEGYTSPQPPSSPQYDSLPHQNGGSVDSPSAEMSPVSRNSRTPSSPQYDKLPLNGLDHQSPLSTHSGSDPRSPHHDGVPAGGREQSPVYDSLQKSTEHTPSGPSNVDRRYNPQLYVDAIVDDEVAGYSAVAGERGGNTLDLDYLPPARLSPLDFEKEFSHSPFFHPTFVTSTTNC